MEEKERKTATAALEQSGFRGSIARVLPVFSSRSPPADSHISSQWGDGMELTQQAHFSGHFSFRLSLVPLLTTSESKFGSGLAPPFFSSLPVGSVQGIDFLGSAAAPPLLQGILIPVSHQPPQSVTAIRTQLLLLTLVTFSVQLPYSQNICNSK